MRHSLVREIFCIDDDEGLEVRFWKPLDIAIVIFLAACLVLLFLPHDSPGGAYRMKFNSRIWQSEYASIPQEGALTHRQKMIGDVMLKVLPKTNKSDVLRLLGQPEEITHDDDDNADYFIYLLGPLKRSELTHHEWLFVRFIKDDFKDTSILAD